MCDLWLSGLCSRLQFADLARSRLACIWYLIAPDIFSEKLTNKRKQGKIWKVGGGNHIIQHGCSLGCSFIVYWKALQRILLFTVMDFSPFSFSSQIARPFCLGLHFGKMKLNEVWREFWAFVAVFSFRVATLFQPSQTPCGQSAPVTHCRAGMKPVPHTLTREWFGSIQQESVCGFK